MNIAEPFVRRPVMTGLVMLSILIFGLIAYRALPISDLPNVDFPTIQVTATLPGASPETMASAVATPLEKQFSTIAALDSMTSTSANGVSQITLQFSLDRNIDAAAQDVQSAISTTLGQLPPEMTTPPAFRKVNPADTPVLFLTMSSDTYPLSTVDEYAETLLAQRISTIAGVAQVLVYGQQKYAVRVQLDPSALAARGLGLDEVQQAVAKQNVNLPTGTLYGQHRAYTVLGTADQAQNAVREGTERLLKIQVQTSETRRQIDDILDDINVADTALREQVFVIDSPPIWRALSEVDFKGTWYQVKTIVSGTSARATNFYQAYRPKLLFYFAFNVAISLLLLHFSRTDPSTWNLSDDRQHAIFRRPMVLATFVMLVFFGVFFAKAPPELVRFSRMLLVIPVAILAIAIFERRIQSYVVALGAVYVVNVTSLQLLAGTVMRRLIDLAICLLMLGGMYILLRKGGVIRTMLDERKFHFVLNGLYCAGFVLALALITNVVGNFAFSDVLTNGTVFSVYYVIGAYVYYFALTAIVCAVTGSSIGQRSRAIRMHRDLVNRKIAKWLRLTAWIIWGVAVLLSFQILNQAYSETREVLRKKWEVGAISISLLDIVLFVLVFYLSTVIAKVIRFLLNEEVLPRTDMNPGAAQAGSRLTYIALLTVGFFLSLGAAGLELSKITVLTGAFGVGLGFGLQNVVNNFVCGIIVSLERPVQVGDSIEVGTLLGEVRSIGFRSCTVRTFDGADVIVPNSELITKPVVNWSLTDLFRRTDIVIGAAYGTDPKLVIQILQELTNKHPGVMKYPEPLITFDQFADSSLNFTVRFWSKLDDRLQVRSELNIRIADAFEKHGIEIPFQQRDIHLHLDKASGKSLPGQLESRPARAS